MLGGAPPLLLARSLLQQAAPILAASGFEDPDSRIVAKQMRVDLWHIYSVIFRLWSEGVFTPKLETGKILLSVL